MLEDHSTNGTVVDEKLLLKARARTETKRTLCSGSQIKIPMHKETRDLVFTVRIPLREGRFQEAYERNFVNYMNRLIALEEAAAETTIVPGPGGHVSSLGSVV